MGYIHIKITDIEIPNNFRVLYKEDDGLSKPYPIDGDSWTDYGALVSVSTPIFTGGTTEVWLSGSTISNPDLPDFQYGTTYWIKLEEYDYPDRYVIKNIRIFDSAAFEEVAPDPSPSASPLPTQSVTPSITRTSTPSRTPSPSYVPVTPSPTPTITPSMSMSSSVNASQSPTPSRTPSVSPTESVSEVYYASLNGEIGIMGVNNPNGRIFSITFNYELYAECDNGWSLGGDAVQATSYFFISTNGGSTWSEIDSVTAEVPGGDIVEQSDTETKYGSYTLTGITDVTQVRVLGQYDCDWAQNVRRGTINVWITGVTVNVGTAAIICDDKYHVACLDTPTLSCEAVPSSPSPSTSVTPSMTRTPTPSPEVITALIYNNSGSFANTSIVDVWVAEQPLFNMSPEFPLWPGDNGLGRSARGTGTWDVIVYLVGTDIISKKMTLIDSTGYEHCQNVSPGVTEVNFFGVQLNSTGQPDPYEYYGNVSMIIEFFDGGTCPAPPPQSQSVTPSITPSLSLSKTPGLSQSVTPSTSPTTFGYYIDIYTCNGANCGNYLSSAWIQNNYYMTIGEWYKYDNDYVYYVASAAPLGGDVINLPGTGYSNCNVACASSPI